MERDKARPSRSPQGFDLRPDGTYSDIGSGPTDASQEAEGTWSSASDGTLTLSPTDLSLDERKLRFLETDEDRLIVEHAESTARLMILMFDLGDTLESNDVLLPGAKETLQAINELETPEGVRIELALISDWMMPNEPQELDAFKTEYYELLSRLGLREFFEPVHRRVTLSSEVGVNKPDPTIFRAAIDKMQRGARFEDVFFVTENASHVAAARRLGMRAVHFKGPRQISGDIAALIDLVPLVEDFAR